MRMFHVGTLATLLACTVSAEASCQADVLTGLLSRITDVNMFATAGYLYPKPGAISTHRPTGKSRRDALTGYGFEFSFQVAEGLKEAGKEVVDRSAKLTKMVVTKNSAGGTDTTFEYDAEETHHHDRDKRKWLSEFAIGYGQVAGFYSTDASFDLRGSLRELPSASFYVTLSPDDRISPYVGVRSGLAQLHETRIYDAGATGPVYTADAQTFQAGLVAGAVIAVSGMNIFAEGAYMHRNFPSVDIKGTDDNMIPSRFPRSLNFSGIYLQAGFQVGIGKAEK